MPIYKRGKSWLVSIGSGKGRFRATCASELEASQVEAQELTRRAQAKLTGTHNIPAVVPVETVQPTMLQAYHITRRLKWGNNSGVSVANAEMVLELLGRNTPVKDVTYPVVRELSMKFEDQGNSAATVNKKLSALSMMLKSAEDEGWIDRAPRMPRRKEPKHRIRFFDGAEERKMLAICNRRGLTSLADFIEMGIDTGFRKSELLYLPKKDCVNRRATLHADKTKTEQARSVPLTGRAQEIVEKRMGRINGPHLFEDLSENKLRLQWDILRMDMGLFDDPNFVIHTLRHTCASRLAMAGKSAVFIKEWMGHSTIITTQRYMHLSPEHLDEGVIALDNYRRA